MIAPLDNLFLVGFLFFVNVVCAGYDIGIHKIPNLVTFPAMLTVLCYYSALYGWDGFFFSTVGLLTGIGLLLLPFLLGGMGAGDAKFMGVVGACLGTQRTIHAFLFIVAVGLIYAIFVIITHRQRFKGYFLNLWLTAQTFMLTRKYVQVEPESVAITRPKVYYGIAIAAGTLLYVSLDILGYQPLA